MERTQRAADIAGANRVRGCNPCVDRVLLRFRKLPCSMFQVDLVAVTLPAFVLPIVWLYGELQQCGSKKKVGPTFKKKSRSDVRASDS
jgi:hypothetical protein